MFCSTCKKLETTLRACCRRICPLGHVACEKCGDQGGDASNGCPVCNMEFFNLIHVEFVDGTPCLFISGNSDQTTENHESSNFNNSELGSFQKILEDDKNFDLDGIDDKVESVFEVVEGKVNSDLSISLGEDEMEMLKCFRICNKSPQNLQQQIDEKSQSDKFSSIDKTTVSRRHDQLNNREVQTSDTYVVQESSCNKVHHATKQSKNSSTLMKSLNTSMNNFYFEEDFGSSTNSFHHLPSTNEIFMNQSFVEDSEAAHFTSLTVSPQEGQSPPDSPPKKGIPSTGHRVKFSSFYNLEHCIPAQMEPLTMFEVDASGSSESSDEVASDRARKLPRFPVQCPITNCESNSVPSDFCNHITIDHPYIDVMKVAPGNIVNIEINSKMNLNMINCQRLLLVTDKITDIGYGTFENTLPIVLLTSKMSLHKVFGCSKVKKDESFFIFLVGVYQFPINYSITLWSHGRDDSEPTMIKSMTDSVLFMSKPLTPKKILTHSLVVSHLELQTFTNNGGNMLSCQIMFH